MMVHGRNHQNHQKTPTYFYCKGRDPPRYSSGQVGLHPSPLGGSSTCPNQNPSIRFPRSFLKRVWCIHYHPDSSIRLNHQVVYIYIYTYIYIHIKYMYDIHLYIYIYTYIYMIYVYNCADPMAHLASYQHDIGRFHHLHDPVADVLQPMSRTA